MTVPAPPTLTPAPSPAPTRADPANFNVRADAYHTWLVPHVNTELPAVFTWMTARQNDVVGLVEDAEDQVALAANQVTLASNQVTLAANQVTLAEAAAGAASAAANASIWVSGQTYAVGVVRFSPINFLSYRRKTEGAGTTDPSLDSTNWALVAGTGDVTLTGTQTLTNKTLTAPESTGAIFDNGSVRGNVVAVAALDIDCTAGNYFTKTISANSTFTFSSPPSSRSYAFTLELTHTSGTVTWPAAVQWPGGTAPTLANGKTSLFVFVTDDGGTRWRGAALVDYTT
jgi:hypothetical protein